MSKTAEESKIEVARPDIKKEKKVEDKKKEEVKEEEKEEEEEEEGVEEEKERPPVNTRSRFMAMPQQAFPMVKRMGADGGSDQFRLYDLAKEMGDTYFLAVFFPMDFTVDSAEMAALVEIHPQLEESKCR